MKSSFSQWFLALAVSTGICLGAQAVTFTEVISPSLQSISAPQSNFGNQLVLGCDSCPNVNLTLHTGLGGQPTDLIWQLVSAPAGVSTGLVNILYNPSAYGIPQQMNYSNWISPTGTLSQVEGEYIYQASFDIPPCGPNEIPQLRMCLLGENAEVTLNGTVIGHCLNQFNTTQIVLNPGQYLNYPGANWLKVILQNPDTQYPVIDAKVWICCVDNSQTPVDSCPGPVRYLHSGWQQLPGNQDNLWLVQDQWSGSTWSVCDVIANPVGWNNPQPGSNWISPPQPYTPGGIYTFQALFYNDILCPMPVIPELKLGILAESASVYLNGFLVGSANSLTTPTVLSDNVHFVVGANYLTVILNYSTNLPVISLKAWICCNDLTETILCGNKAEGWTSFPDFYTSYFCAQEYQCPGNETVLKFNITTDYRVSVKSNSSNPTEKIIIAQQPLPWGGGLSSQVLACGNNTYPATADLPAGDYFIIIDDYMNPGSHYFNVELRCDPVPTVLPCPQLNNLYNLDTGHPSSTDPNEDKFWNYILSPATIITNPANFGWGPPQGTTKWISYNANPSNVTDSYIFGFSFIIPSTCINPFIQMSVLGAVGDMYLSDPMLTNVHQIGETRSLTDPFLIAHSYYLLPGNNTFYLILRNYAPNYPGINVTGTVCCEGGPAGIEENPAEKGYTIFPNPANDELQIETSVEINGIHIYNGFGQLVYESGTVKELTRIPVDHLKEGIYFIRLQMAQGCYSEKVLIEH